MEIGKLNIHGADVEDWFERFELYCVTNTKIKENNKIAFFFTQAGEDTYSLAKDLAFPKKPKDLTYDEAKSLLVNHLKPRNFTIKERATFNTLLRKPEQNIKDFIRTLQKQASKCNFGDNLEDQLRDRLLAGINDAELQKKMLLDSALTFSKAKEICETTLSVQNAINENSSVLLMRDETCRQKYSAKPRFSNNHQASEFDKTKEQGYPNSKSKTTASPNATGKCFSCGASHFRQDCKFRNATCHGCGKIGHIKKVCRRSLQVRVVEEIEHDEANELTVLGINSAKGSHLRKSYLVLTPDGLKPLSLIQDTGSPVSFITQKVCNDLFGPSKIQPCDVTVSGVTGHTLSIKGELYVDLKSDQNGPFHSVRFLITEKGPCVLGLEELRSIEGHLTLSTQVESPEILDLITKCSELRGGMRIQPVSLEVSCDPIFQKSRPIPYGLRDAVHSGLQKLVDEGIVTPVESSQWGTPIVTPLKADGKPRICGDFKVTLNPHLKKKSTTTREPEDLFINLKDQCYFSKIDLENAFLQIPLSDESRNLTTINTPFGMYSYNYLPFGLSTSPSIFQQTIDGIIQDLPGVISYQDDLLTYGKTIREHDENLKRLLERLIQFNVKINAKKSTFRVTQISYLGYLIDHQGMKPDPKRLEPLLHIATPTTFDELRSLLGCFQYYSRYIPNFAVIASDLFELMARTREKFVWTDTHEKALTTLKDKLKSVEKLKPFSLTAQSRVVVDASESGLGVVLEQEDFPIVCVSRRLSKAEQAYSQTQKEALAVVWGVKRLHKFLFGTKFSIVTDHRSLEYIFKPTASLSKGTSNMLQRWSIFLSGYDYDIIHRPGKSIPQADFLSRYAIEESTESSSLFIQPLPVSRELLSSETKKFYGPVIAAIKRGWSTTARKKYHELYVKREELSLTVDGLICWKEMILIPPQCRNEILKFLHDSHLGVDKMKSLSRLSVYWPSINLDIASFCASCQECKLNKPVRSTNTSWPCPFRPWQRLHMDYCGPFFGSYYALVVIDAYSKWPEVFLTHSASSDFTMTALRKCFSREGLPQVIVSDNGTHFTSSSIRDWLAPLGVKQVFSAPRHPQSNGLAENFVRSLKVAIRTKNPQCFSELDRIIDNFLLSYRNAKHSTTNEAPSLLLKGRILHHPPHGCVEVSFWKGNDNRVSHGVILSCIGNTMFNILDLSDGSVHRRHRDQVRITGAAGVSRDNSEPGDAGARYPAWTPHPGPDDPARISNPGPDEVAADSSSVDGADPGPDEVAADSSSMDGADPGPGATRTRQPARIPGTGPVEVTADSGSTDGADPGRDGTRARYPTRTRRPPDNLHGYFV